MTEHVCVHETARREETKGSGKEEGIWIAAGCGSNYGGLCIAKGKGQPRPRSFGSKGIIDGPKMYSYVMKQDNNSRVLVRTCSRNTSARTIGCNSRPSAFPRNTRAESASGYVLCTVSLLTLLAIPRILSHKPSIGLCSVLFVIYIRVCFAFPRSHGLQ